MAPDDNAARKEQDYSHLLASYRAKAGASDELMDSAGNVRAVWRPFLSHLAQLTPDDITRRFARGNQYLNDAGVFFRQYGVSGPSEREWPLSHIPVIISDKEWRKIADGLMQRARLLELVAADLYGENRLVRDGYLPAGLIAKSPEWLRPLVGVKPRSGNFLHFLAFELGRGPDGTWWVLSDRAQAPSGAGFALENRVATGRVFADYFAKADVQRLAGFFRSFRDRLQDMRAEPDSRVSILTPGPMNDTYFEHAYIARYLGFMLLEGEDLTVQDGKLMVRTVSGLQPVSVLWRRLDSAWSDPVELNETSQIGTPGMVEAVRNRSVAMVNALGTGVLEMRALLAFLPRICETMMGEPLKLPNVATWWCGAEDARAYVARNADNMMLGPALSTSLPFTSEETEFIGTRFNEFHKGGLSSWIESQGDRLVGQEAVTLSTTPAYAGGQLHPRPMSLRVFLARTARGWQVMSGGFARIGTSADANAIAMHAGGYAADVWVVGGRNQKRDSLLTIADSTSYQAQGSVLPSRAADNLFWLGRYVERAECAVRLLRAYHARLLENGDPNSPLVAQTASYLITLGVDPATPIPDGLTAILQSAVNSAGKVRDRFSVDGWLAVNELAQSARELRQTIEPGADIPRELGQLLRKITGFSGLVHENMYQFVGWRFLIIGRSLERAFRTAEFLAEFTAPDAPEGALEFMLEIGDSAMSMSRRYAVSLSRSIVLDLLAMDTRNPRSVHYQLSEMQDHISVLPGARNHSHMSDLSRSMLKLHTELAVATPGTLSPETLMQIRNRIGHLSDELTAAYIG